MSNRENSPPSIGALRSQLQAAWDAGKKLRVEKLVKQYAITKLRREECLELILAEYQLRIDSGETPVDSEYLTRFPTLKDDLERLLLLQRALLETNRNESSESSVDPDQASYQHSVNRSQLVDRSAGVNASRNSESESTLLSDKSGPQASYIGRYRVISELGKGGFGIVYKAFDPQMDRDVAIKLLRPDRSVTEEAKSRFVREARTVAGISHPNICPIFSIDVNGDAYVLVFPFVEGRTLAAELANRTYTVSDIVSLMIQLCRALAHAHQMGVIHRDLKPANIMIEPNGIPVIMDFGLARRQDAGDTKLTMQGDVLGTPWYMSPEQARGDQAAVGPATDIYSLGVIFYELLCGRRPYSGALSELFSKIHSGKFPKPRTVRPSIPEELEKVCLKALSVDPSNRFAGMNEFHDAIQRFHSQPTSYGSAASSPVNSTTGVSLGSGTRKRSLQLTDRKKNPQTGHSFSLGSAFHSVVRQPLGILIVVSIIGLVGLSATGMMFLLKRWPANNQMSEDSPPEEADLSGNRSSSASLASALFLRGAWHVHAETEDANFNGILDEGEDQDKDGKISQKAPGFAFFIDRDGHLAIQDEDRLLGGPEHAGGIILDSKVDSLDASAGTASIRFEAKSVSEQETQSVLLAKKLPAAWQLRLIDAHQLQGLELRWTDVIEVRHRTVARQVPQEVPYTYNETQPGGKVVQKTGYKTELVAVYETRQEEVVVQKESRRIFLAHRLGEDCFSGPDTVGNSCIHIEAVSGESMGVDRAIKGAVHGKSKDDIRFEGRPAGNFKMISMSPTASGAAISFSYTSPPDLIGPDIAWLSIPSMPQNAPERCQVLSVWSEQKKLAVPDEFCVVWQQEMKRDDPFASAGPPAPLSPAPLGANSGSLIHFQLPVEKESAMEARFEVLSKPQHGELFSAGPPTVQSVMRSGSTEPFWLAAASLEYAPAPGFLGGDKVRFRWTVGKEVSREATLLIWVAAGDRPASGMVCPAPAGPSAPAPAPLPSPMPAAPAPVRDPE